MDSSSLKNRYFFKLSTNFLGLLVGLLVQGIVPRSLGPKLYGDFNFLESFFSQIFGFLDMGISTAFFTKLSQRPKDHHLVSFYFFYSVAVSAVLVGFVFFLHLTGFHRHLLLGQDLFFMYLAGGLAVVTWFNRAATSMADAFGLTIPLEKARFGQRIIGVILVAGLYFLGILSLSTYFFFNYFITILLLFIILLLFHGQGILSREWFSFSAKAHIETFWVFFEYCQPLISYSVCAVFVGIAERWLLQKYGGSEHQGYFALSSAIGTICFLFTSSMTPLLMREFSIAFEKENLQHLAGLFRRYIPVLYAIAAYFSCFVAIEATRFIAIFGGEKFSGAIVPMTIMAFYPIHQTYGQLSSSVFYATAQTRLFRNIGVFIMLTGLALTFFLLGPREMWGLNAGATGLAVKTVLLQFICVNIQLFYCARFLNLHFWKYALHQVICVVSMLFLAYVSSLVSHQIPFGVEYFLPSFLFSGVLYTLSLIILTNFVPEIFGLQKRDIFLFKGKIRHLFQMD